MIAGSNHESLSQKHRDVPGGDCRAQPKVEKAEQLTAERELTTVQSQSNTASVEDLRSLFNPKVTQNERKSNTSWIGIAVILIIEVLAIIYQARWVPSTRMRIKQAVQRIESNLAGRLEVAVAHQDHQLMPNEQKTSAVTSAPSLGKTMDRKESAVSNYAPKGTASVEYQLALRYAAGAGVPQDENKAVELFKRAANEGHPAAQRALSELYLRGQGVRKDLVRAYTWASIAKNNGNQLTPELRSIESKMTPNQINDAEKRVAAWRNSQPIRP